MNRIFIDTSAFYALADKKDPAHRKARKFLEKINIPLVTTDFIFAETMSLITKRLGKNIAIEFGKGIKESSIIDLMFLSVEYQNLAWDLFCSQEDKEWDFIDCTCFIAMEKIGIMTAFSLDRHFAQRGFAMAPD